ncbi:MAG: putative sulfate exporter family transporter [Methanoregulaceae archaeon]|nr:putative sulfate exporter family transporter [Methanoregulaceae archaeon]
MKLVPGLLVAVFLAALAYAPKVLLPNLTISPLLTVILLGMVIASLMQLPFTWKPGLQLAQKPILRWGVAGLGFKLSLQELASIGGSALVVVVVSTVAALAFGWWLGRRVGLPDKMNLLLGVGGGICGASAIVAADTVVQGEQSDSALPLGIITLVGTVGIVVYPLLGNALNLSPFVYGVWNGASLHEMAQVIAAGNAIPDAISPSTVTKLARICLLAPVVFYLGWMLRKKEQNVGEAKVPLVPWFLVVFVLLAAFRTLVEVPKSTAKLVEDLDLFVLCVGMAGVGLFSDFRQIVRAGVKPILVGVGQWVFLAALALALTLIFCK